MLGSAGFPGGPGLKGPKGPDGDTGATGATGLQLQEIHRRVVRQAAGCPGTLQYTRQTPSWD